MDDMQKRYTIDTLLKGGVQPFNDLDDEAISALAEGLGRGKALAVPIVVTSDGVLIDGHQRLRALRADGRKFIDAHDVRVIADADAENAIEWAVKLNVQRRHLTVEEKAEVARRLQAERGWGQRKIAKLFGVSQPAVSQWLNPPTPDADKPEPPKPSKPRPIVKTSATVLNEANRLAEELTNPELGRWVVTYVDDDDREAVSMRWDAIAKAAARIVEQLGENKAGTDKPF